GACGAGDMRTRAWRRPRARMQPGFDRKRKQSMPGRVKFDFVDAVTVAVERAQHWRVGIGGIAKPYGFRLSQPLAERADFVRRPPGVLARKRRTKHAVSLQKIVRLERRRLVGDLISDLVHRCVSQR